MSCDTHQCILERFLAIGATTTASCTATSEEQNHVASNSHDEFVRSHLFAIQKATMQRCGCFAIAVAFAVVVAVVVVAVEYISYFAYASFPSHVSAYLRDAGAGPCNIYL